LVPTTGVMAGEVPTGRADAVVDLGKANGVKLVKGHWRYSDTKIVEVPFRSPGPDLKPSGPPNTTYDFTPHAEGKDLDDAKWEVIEPDTLGQRRSTGKLCFCWYRLRVTIPERIGEFDPTGSTAVFEIVVDDYAEIWVDGKLPRELGQSGGNVVKGFNVPNRLVIGRDIKPGRQIQLAIFAMNGPISATPANFIYIRYAKLEFYANHTTKKERVGNIVRLDPRFDRLVPPDAKLEKVADGHTWVEGPVWDRRNGYLLFSDIPRNAVYRWFPGAGASEYLKPSGYTGKLPFAGREPGSNGLAFDAEGRLVLCEHGDRRIARLEKDERKTPLADRFEGKRLNSPNDLVFKSNGDLYFTDPPFGLPKAFDDPGRELPFCGVYRLSRDGRLTLLTKEIKAPNGIAFSPDEKTLYVTNADPDNALWLAYEVKVDGTLGTGRVFFDASSWTKAKKGAPDGMKVDKDGNLFAAGPGGLHVFAPDGTHLGSVELGVPTSNCTWGEDGSVLYISADAAIYRIKLTTKGE
jgi:gluconolactonase